MKCNNCGKEIPEGTKFCPECGSSQKEEPIEAEAVKVETEETKTDKGDVSSKNRLVACLLAFLLGGLGIHSFYCGKTWIGIAQLALTILGFGLGSIWGIVDGVLICLGNYKDSEGKLVLNWNEE